MSTSSSLKHWRKRSPRSELGVFMLWVLDWAFVTDAPAQFKDIGSRMMPPAWSSVHELWWPLWETIKFVIVASRSINSLIWALLLVAILGPGVLTGILAIALRSIGFIGKLLYEAIEEIDADQVEAIEATGASSAQTMAWGVVPQVAPTLAGISVFRWDINIRESTVLGLVGAGGIGVKLEGALATLAWPKVTMLLILILVTVVFSEWVTAKVREKLI
jgi:phosphonate transport system permease protein